MGRLWSGYTKGWKTDAIACFEDGLVWEGSEPGSESDAIACYGSHRIWHGPTKGWKSDAIGYYDGERIWNGWNPGSESDAIGYYDGELVWRDSNSGRKSDAVGFYEGSPPGAAAATLVLLLGGGEESDASGASDEDSSEDDDSSSHDEDSSREDEDDTDDEDDEDGSSDDSSYEAPRVIEDPPEVVGERRFASANTKAELEQIKERLSGIVPTDILGELYRLHATRLETRRIGGLLEKIEGRTVDSLHEDYKRALAGMTLSDFNRNEHKTHESLELHGLAVNRDLLAKMTEIGVVRMFAEREDPSWAVLARRRLKEIEEEEERRQRVLAEEKEKEDAATLTFLKDTSSETIYEYVSTHEFSGVSVKALATVSDKGLLTKIYLHYRSTPAGKEAKRRYYEVLDEEASRRNIIEKLIYMFTHEYERNL
jgi:hypothetical protein